MKPHHRTPRHGTVLVAVLVCMGFASIVLLGTVQTSLHQRRQIRQEMQMEQTLWLLDKGVTRGIARLQENPDYDGESLSVSPALEDYSSASIEIKVIRIEDMDREVRLHVIAMLGTANDNSSMMKRSREIVIDQSENDSD